MFVWLSFRCLLDLESFRGNGVSASLLIRGYHSVQWNYFLWTAWPSCDCRVSVGGLANRCRLPRPETFRSDSGVAIASSVFGACTIFSRHCIPACCRLRHPDWRRQWGLADQPEHGRQCIPEVPDGMPGGFGCPAWGGGSPGQDDIDYYIVHSIRVVSKPAWKGVAVGGNKWQQTCLFDWELGGDLVGTRRRYGVMYKLFAPVI
jgi:hypothetical protein